MRSMASQITSLAIVYSAVYSGTVNNSEAGDLRRHRGHYDVNVMIDRVITAQHCITNNTHNKEQYTTNTIKQLQWREHTKVWLS